MLFLALLLGPSTGTAIFDPIPASCVKRSHGCARELPCVGPQCLLTAHFFPCNSLRESLAAASFVCLDLYHFVIAGLVQSRPGTKTSVNKQPVAVARALWCERNLLINRASSGATEPVSLTCVDQESDDSNQHWGSLCVLRRLTCHKVP
jgi:hypothetical protein